MLEASLAITIPAEFSWRSRPVVSQDYVAAWSDNSDSDNSNGTVLPDARDEPVPDPFFWITDTTFTESGLAGPSGPTVALNATIVTFPTLIDTAHTSTENCFTFLPSLSVQGSPTERCDCGTTTAALTTQGASTGCALSNSFFAINSFPIETGFPTTTAPGSAAPAPTMLQCMYLNQISSQESDGC